MPIPTQFDADLTKLSQLHASIATKAQIAHNATLRTTVHGDAHVDATRQIKRMKEDVERLLADYAEMARALVNA
jgi:hypothetical protein